MMTYEQLSKLAEESGFTAWASLDVSTLDLKSEVRDMCVVNTCGRYGNCWSCPPGCGTLEECSAELEGFTGGILVQTVGDLEDSFDFEAMVETEQRHKEYFHKMHALLREKAGKVLALGSGSCTICPKCTYPDAPCRFPDKMVSSMEAYGLLVLEVCQANDLQYYYGPDKIAYTSCFLL